MSWQLFLPPFLCAAIGWITNLLAIRMLFRPYYPKRILGLTFHGVLPKRQAAVAERFGEMVESELISHEDIRKIVADPGFLEPFRKKLDERVEHFLTAKLPTVHPMAGMFLGDGIKSKIREILHQEMDSIVPDLLETGMDELEKRLRVRDIVQQKVANFAPDRLEQMLHSILKKEFRFIEWIGGILGFAVGLGQSVLLYVLN